MAAFKSLPLLFCILLVSTSILSINASPIKSATPFSEDETSTSASTFSKLLSYPKKAASKTFETVGAFLSMIGEGLSTDAEEAIPAGPEEPVNAGSEKVEYPPKDDNPYLETETKKESEKPIIKIRKSSESESEKKGIFEKIGEKFEGLI